MHVKQEGDTVYLSGVTPKIDGSYIVSADNAQGKLLPKVSPSVLPAEEKYCAPILTFAIFVI
jgi:hypothetical protein